MKKCKSCGLEAKYLPSYAITGLSFELAQLCEQCASELRAQERAGIVDSCVRLSYFDEDEEEETALSCFFIHF